MGTSSRSGPAHPNLLLEDSKTIVSVPAHRPFRRTLKSRAGFVFRHIACGPPSRGLYKYYDLQHELGKGSFATVMKALHREEGKWYAVKMIQANKLRRGLSSATINGNGNGKGAKSNDKASNFAREINILERLQHPNICQLKEVFFESYNISTCSALCLTAAAYKLHADLVLEWVPGGDLLDYILKRGGLPEPEAQSLTYQICDALAVSTVLYPRHVTLTLL